MSRDLVIIGAGGLARELALYAADCGERVVAFVCDNPKLPDEISFDDLKKEPFKNCNFLLGVGRPVLRRTFRSKLKELVPLMNACRPLVHPTSFVAKSAFLADGVVIAPNCSITGNVLLDIHVFINLNCTIGHDTRIGAFSVVNPGANISGNVYIADRTLIGTGACIREKLVVESDVGMGAVVVKNVKPGDGPVIGNPAKPMNKKDSNGN